ncbi:hypothetical protein [Desulfobacula sp.]|uniref:hypothetical protein n=1 Tax=Desulfobacula sp. TaxID=2593537 RepID=UPI002620160F|nr:hypothetical protein [Desulfobacula sp.]
MMDIVLTVLWFSGFVYAGNRWLKIDFSYAPIFSVSFVGILLFVFAVSNYLKPAAGFLCSAGFILSAIGGIDAWRNRRTQHFPVPVPLFMVLVLLIILSFLVPLGMKFTVIDDYVYWGIIGKYLYLHHHLPDANTAIIERHLAYTPGTSLFHYFFYTLTGRYSPAISYFAQNILLISAFFVVLKKDDFKRTLIFLCLLVILLTLFSGSIFTKLQVDYLLSIYSFAVLWIYFREPPTLLTVFTISLPACFLFLIKEIGIALCLLLLMIILFDLFFHRDLDGKVKFKSIVVVILTGGIVYLLKQTWTDHCQMMEFLKFNTGVNMDSIWQAVQFFSDGTVQKGVWLFVKGIFIGPADRLNLPYVFWYLAVVFFWIKILSKQTTDNKTRYARCLKILGASFAVYLILMYFLQVIVFKVGENYDHTIGLTRYLNIFFCQVVCFTLLLYGDQYLQHIVSNKRVVFFITGVILMIGLSRIETELHRDSHYNEAEQVAKKIEKNIDKGKENLIGIVPGTNDHHLGIKLLYHLLPNRVNHDGFPVQDKDVFLSSLQQYDFVLFNEPGDRIEEWIHPFVETPFDNTGFFKIILGGTDNVKDKIIKLEKVF